MSRWQCLPRKTLRLLLRKLVFYDDFGGAISSTAGTFTLNASTINFNIP